MKTRDEFNQQEKDSQGGMDSYYKEQNWTVDRSVSCCGYDLEIEVELRDGDYKKVKVEEKYRSQDYGDFLVEIMQDAATGDRGWFYKTKADRIFYVIKDRGFYSIKWHKFKAWFKEKLKNKNSTLKLSPVISNDGDGYTINLAVNWSDIPKELYEYKIIKKEQDTYVTHT